MRSVAARSILREMHRFAAIISFASVVACAAPLPPPGDTACDSLVDCATGETCTDGRCVSAGGEGEGGGPVSETDAIASFCAKQSSCVVDTPACADETAARLTRLRAGTQPSCAQAADELVDVLACFGGASCDVFTDVDGADRNCPDIGTALHDLASCEGSVVGAEGEGEGAPGGEGEGEGEGEGSTDACVSLAGFAAPSSSTLTLTSVNASYTRQSTRCDTTFAVVALITVTGDVFSAASAVVTVDGATTQTIAEVNPADSQTVELVACSPARMFFFAVQLVAADGATNTVCAIAD